MRPCGSCGAATDYGAQCRDCYERHAARECREYSRRTIIDLLTSYGDRGRRLPLRDYADESKGRQKTPRPRTRKPAGPPAPKPLKKRGRPRKGGRQGGSDEIDGIGT